MANSYMTTTDEEDENYDSFDANAVKLKMGTLGMVDMVQLIESNHSSHVSTGRRVTSQRLLGSIRGSQVLKPPRKGG